MSALDTYRNRGSQTVTDDAMRCAACKRWKPDEDFARKAKARHRRCRSYECNACEAIRRREARVRLRVKREHGPDAELCGARSCPNIASGTLTYGTWLHEITLSPAGRIALNERHETPLCARCLHAATGVSA